MASAGACAGSRASTSTRSIASAALGAWLLVAGLIVVAAGAPAVGVASAAPATPVTAKSAPAKPAPAKPSPATSPATAIAKPGATAPRFAGRWRLDIARSAFGKTRRVPLSREDVVTLDGPWLAVKSLSVREGNDTLRLEYRYRTDGDAMNTVMGQDVRTRGHRNGATQHFDSEAKFLLVSLLVNEHWALSTDGRTLTVARESKSPMGDDQQQLVFVRQ